MEIAVLLAIALRSFLAVTTRTFFQPDEYFQSLEPAHHIVFSYGQLTWEWTSARPIRSIAYPILNVPIYWMLKVFGWDESRMLVWAPKLLHGLFAAGTDIWVRKLTRDVVGRQYVSTALVLSLTSPFHALSLSRSLSNSLETTLTTIALSHFPWSTSIACSRTQLRKLLMFAALACCIRITNLVVWAFAIPLLLYRLRKDSIHFRAFILDGFGICILALSSLFVLDSAYYGRPTFTPLSFLQTNASSVSLFYGRSPWHYYLAQGFPILLGPALPYALHGIWTILRQRQDIPDSSPDKDDDNKAERESRSARATALALLGWTTAVYSCAGHKEWRFLHPMLPLLHVLAAKSLVDLSSASRLRLEKTSSTKSSGSIDVKRSTFVQTTTASTTVIDRYLTDASSTDLLSTSSQPSQSRDGIPTPALQIGTFHMIFLVLLSLPVIVWVTRYHGHAQVEVVRYLHDLGHQQKTTGEILSPPMRSIGFLMPCHSTPGQAYLHTNLGDGQVWSLSCEPPLGLVGEALSSYKDQTDVFYDSPVEYLNTRFPPVVDPTFAAGQNISLATEVDHQYPWVHAWPSHLVFFGSLLSVEWDQASISNLNDSGGDTGRDQMSVESMLREKGYVEVWSRAGGWRGWEIEEDVRRRGGVRVWAWSPSLTSKPP